MAYLIQSGDTLSKIAQQNNTTVAELAKLNNITDPNKIYAGQNLNLPTTQAPGAGVVSVGLAGAQPGVQPTTFNNLSPTLDQDTILRAKTSINAMLEQVKGLQAQVPVLQAQEAQAQAPQINAAGNVVGSGATTGGNGILGSGQTPTPATTKTQDRITALESSAFARPTKTYADVKKDVYADLGINSTENKTKVSALDTKIAQAKNDLITAETEITNNAWLSESGRVGRIKTLYDLAEKTISNLIEQRTSAWNEYTYGEEQVDKATTRILAEEETGRKLNKEELDYLQKQMTGEETEPKTFGTAETGYYIWEQDTDGKWTTKQVIAPKEKTAIASEITKIDYSWVDELINLNPNASYEELYDEAIKNTTLSPSEIKTYLENKGKKTAETVKEEKPFLSTDYFRTLFTEEQLKTSAEKAGLMVKRRFLSDIPDTEGYLNYLMKLVEQYRTAGKTDAEILNMMK